MLHWPIYILRFKRTGNMSHSSLYFQGYWAQSKYLFNKCGMNQAHSAIFCSEQENLQSPHWVYKGPTDSSHIGLNICEYWLLSSISAKTGTSVVATWLSTSACYVPLPKCAAVSWVGKLGNSKKSDKITAISAGDLWGCWLKLITWKLCYNVINNNINTN